MSAHLRTRLLFLVTFCSFCLTSSAWAEVTLDGTLGRIGPLSGPNYLITSDMGKQLGPNLFHSFGTFNINTGESASFSGPSSITNIISRVTGSSSSWIDGPLHSEIPGANLYLINPKGLVFGPNASLDISGSFHASTADYLKLGQDGYFYATNTEKTVLTSAAPSAFGFVTNTPKEISINGSFLTVPAGKEISLIGGDLSIKDASVYAPSGMISLISAASSGEAVVAAHGFEIDSFRRMGTIETIDSRPCNQRLVYDFNAEMLMGNLDVSGAESGGEVRIRAGRFVLNNGWVFADTYGDGSARGIDIDLRQDLVASNASLITSAAVKSGVNAGAGNITIKASDSVVVSGSSITSETSGVGNGGTISVETNNLSLTELSKLSTRSNEGSQGNAGDIAIRASDSVVVSGHAFENRKVDRTLIQSETWGEGNAGSILIETGKLMLTDLSIISAVNALEDGQGNAGNITIKASDSVLISGHMSYNGLMYGSAVLSETWGRGDAGSIFIKTGNLSLTDAGRISTTAREGSEGNAGNITINASDMVSISGNAMKWYSLIGSDTLGKGNAGAISVNSEKLSLADGGRISTTAYEGSEGNAGNITINASDMVSISGHWEYDNTVYKTSIASRTRGTGNGGSITLDAGNLQMDRQASISAESFSIGRGGDVTIRVADSIQLLNESTITTKTVSSDGGDIQIKAPQLIYLSNGDVSTSVQGGLGDGGNVLVGSQFVILNKSDITANAYGGNGGNIDILSGYFIASPGSSNVQASSQLGISGAVNITSPEVDLSGSLNVLPSNYLDATSLMSDRCIALLGEKNSLVVIGRGGMPVEPDNYLPSP